MSGIGLREFADRIGEIMPIIIKEFMKQQKTSFYKVRVTMPQFVILTFLTREGEMRMSDLARSMGVTTAAMTGIVDRLVRDRYVVRSYDPKDRRVIRIKTTLKGDGLVKDTHEERRKMVIDIFGRVSQHDREEYLRILTKIRDILIKEKGA